MKRIIFTVIGLVFFSFCGFAQKMNMDSIMTAYRDSSLKAMIHADSVKVEGEYTNAKYWNSLNNKAIYPALKAGEYSGVIPVSNPTELPDPKMDYKLLFEVTEKNPDSTAKDINNSLMEVARIINLHAASGIPLNKIMPVIIVHGGALNAISTNAHYQKRYKTDNPNLKAIADLEKLGTRFIACGQAMAFLRFEKEDLLPEVKISLTAQTVLSTYQLKGYVLYSLSGDKK